ncbi:ATP phosphoribosyltransferase regulatory subunit [Streptococcus dentapri]|uniref:ATP phosphoribosyltransferase regulatory subunit n=1 Tax=Streptococcus dentapri TaxID=573564 RepID=A0ABV8D1G9_9STRE
MRFEPTSIPLFFDILEDELYLVNTAYNRMLEEFKKYGYREIKTSKIEQRDKYLNATKVHWSKIFEVHRSKERSKFLLQSDLAISMSRYVAYSKDSSVIRLIQMGDIYRDRIPFLPGYRREFQQILTGIWGISHISADLELLYLNFKQLSSISGIRNLYLQISNQQIFEDLKQGLSEEIRFSGIDSLFELDIEKNDLLVLKDLFNQGKIEYNELKKYYHRFSIKIIKSRISEILYIFEKLKEKGVGKVVFNLSNLGGTGHYSGFNYRFYANVNDSEELLIADGGRIDSLVSKFNSNADKPAVCIGIGIQVIAQFLDTKEGLGAVVLIDNEDKLDKADKYSEYLRSLNFRSSIILLPKKKWKNIFLSKYYSNFVFVIINNYADFEIRSDNMKALNIIDFNKLKEL